MLTETQGGNPTDESVDVRRRRAHDASLLQELGHLHDVEKSEQIHWVRSVVCKMGENVSIGGPDACCDCQ